jgi:hypothetical protein
MSETSFAYRRTPTFSSRKPLPPPQRPVRHFLPEGLVAGPAIAVIHDKPVRGVVMERILNARDGWWVGFQPDGWYGFQYVKATDVQPVRALMICPPQSLLVIEKPAV